ncbi:hypothetical protein [Streptomyces sp. NPDC127197]|uniref:hypothetical protein n=1 Tax=Streptomyces sp. NPDC127197 TaxID=3345388 RepID=UPI00363D84A4
MPYALLPGQLSVEAGRQLRDVTPELTPGERVLETTYGVTYKPSPKLQANTLQISTEDLDARDPEWPQWLGVAAMAAKRRYETIGTAIKAMGVKEQEARGWLEAYAATGLLLRPGKEPVFLRQGAPALTPTGATADVMCGVPAALQEDPGTRALALDDPSEETFPDDLAELMGFLETAPDDPAVPVAMLAQLMWAPWSSINELGKVHIVLAASTGHRKTSLAGGIVAAQSRHYTGGPGVEVPVAVKMRGNQSTVFGTDLKLHLLNGMVGVVDDYFAGQMTPKEVHQAWVRFGLIADNAATGAGGTRGAYRNGRQTLAKNVYPRCCVLATAEDLPEEAEHGSEVARYVALRMEGRGLNLEALSRLQAQSRALSRAHATMIQRGLRDLELPRKGLAWATEATTRWNFAGHNRVEQNYRKLMAGAWLLAQHLESAGLGGQWFLEYADEHLREAAMAQARRNGVVDGKQVARDPVWLWLREAREVLAGKPFWLAAPERKAASAENGGEPEYQVPSVPGFGPSSMGWRQIGQAGGWAVVGQGDPLGAVHVQQDTGRTPWRPVVWRMRATMFARLHDEIVRRVRERGWSIPAEPEMRHKLAQAGILKAPNGVVLDLFGARVKCLSLDLVRILSGEMPGAEPEPDDDQAGGDDSGGDGGEGGEPSGEGPEPAPPAAAEPLPAFVPAILPESEEEPSGGPEGPSEPVSGPSGASGPAVPAQARRDGITGSQEPVRTGASEVGVLDVDGLHVRPGEAPIPVSSLPMTLSAAYALAVKESVLQLWIHPRAAERMGLPASRPSDIPIHQPVPHVWTDLPKNLDADPVGGLVPWSVVWHRDSGRKESGVSIVLPQYEPRVPWVPQEGETAGAPDGASLLQAVVGLNRALGHSYYQAPNITAAQYVHRHTRSAEPCKALIRGEVRPAARIRGTDDHPTPVRQFMHPASWSRPLLDEEEGAVFVHRYDLSAAELSGMDAVYGIGEPVHMVGGDIPINKKIAGYYLLAEEPRGLDPRLPQLLFAQPKVNGEPWVTGADLHWLGKFTEEPLPDVVEAYVWKESVRALAATRTHLQKGREVLLTQRGTPAGETAYKAHGALYKSLIGYLARTSGPRNEADALWRPDWRDHLKAETYGRMYYSLQRIGQTSGRYPVATYVDAAYWVSNSPDPIESAPKGMVLGSGGGQWKHEACVPLAAVREHLGEKSFKRMFERELKKQEGGR